MGKRLSCFLLLVLICLRGWAVPVPSETARKKAMAMLSDVSGRPVECQPLQAETVSDADGTPLFHVFNAEGNRGFAIITADGSDEVIGYSTTGSFDKRHMPANMKAVLQHSRPGRATTRRHLPRQKVARETIGPLLSTQWDQGVSTSDGDIYNLLTPTLDGRHTLTGCVATAMAQIMYYHRWPIEVSDSIPGYECSQVGVVDSLPPTTFDWDMIPSNPIGIDPSQIGDGIARLMLYCAHAVKTNYGLKRSEAYGSDAAKALCDYFGYAPTSYLRCDEYDADEWEQMVYDELSCSRPVIYFGFSATGGHAFICDGCDDQGFYHINWGWGGQCDGYFKLSALTPDIDDAEGLVGDRAGYTLNQHAILGITPKNDAKENIVFADSTAKAVCISRWDADGDGELSFAEAEAVLTLNGAFTGNESLTQFDELQYFTRLKQIGTTAFSGCTHLESVVLPEGITALADKAFYGCTHLQSIHIPALVSEIGKEVFGRCEALAQLTVSEANTTYDARGHCNAIIRSESDILIAGCHLSEIPESVVEIGDDAFKDCTGLTQITLSPKIHVIGNGAFAGCTSLSTIYSHSKQPPLCGNDAFMHCRATVYVPKGMKMAYMKAREWRNLIIVEDESDDFIHCERLAFTRSAGGTLQIGLKNLDEIVGLQFCLTLPDGVQIRHDERGYDIQGTYRLTNHTIYCNRDSDNSYLILVMSLDLDKIAGHEGAMMEIGIEADDTLPAGDYEMTFSDITLSIIEEETISGVRPKDFTAPLRIRDFDLGDVNCDRHVNIADVMMIVSHILLYPTDNFHEELADVNDDNRIDVVDVTRVIQAILRQPKEVVEDDAEPDPSGPVLTAISPTTYALHIDHAESFTALQMRLDLPEGADLGPVRTSQGHQVTLSPIGGNSYRVIVYSPDGKPFANDQEQVLRIETSGGGASITVSDLVATNQHFDLIGFNQVTSIQTPPLAVTGEPRGATYNLSGQEIGKDYKGIVISQGKKTVRK